MKYCTLTGADVTTDPKDLLELSKKYPFVEWGILYSESKMGTGRYPTIEWIYKLMTELAEDWLVNNIATPVNTCLHLCGSAVKKFIDGTDPVLEALVQLFDRIQLNYRHENYRFMDIVYALSRHKDKQIISQCNKANPRDFFHSLWDEKNHIALFDSSGGRGIETIEWQKPVSYIFTGYAGGLGPDNVVQELEKIKLVTGNQEFYIDMENKLRTDDKFDLTKVEQVLKLVQPYHKSN